MANLPPELQDALMQVDDPELRKTIARAAAATIPTPEEEEAERKEQERQRRKAEAKELKLIALKVTTRAIEGEWGDDVRRAVDQLVEPVRAEVAVIAEWGKRAARGEAVTPVEWAAVLRALRSDPVKKALWASDRVISEAEKERKGAAKR